MKAASEEQARFVLERSLRVSSGSFRAAREARGAQFPLAPLHGDASALLDCRPRSQAHVRHRRDRGDPSVPHVRHWCEHGRVQRDRRERGRRRRDRHRRALGRRDLVPRARSGRLPILPLVGNFGRPTPALGWRNRELESLLGRAAERFRSRADARRRPSPARHGGRAGRRTVRRGGGNHASAPARRVRAGDRPDVRGDRARSRAAVPDCLPRNSRRPCFSASRSNASTNCRTAESSISPGDAWPESPALGHQ